MNYCKTCRRHLNGAVSCPGCGATGLEIERVQDVRSTVRMPKIPVDAEDAGAGYADAPGDGEVLADLEFPPLSALDIHAPATEPLDLDAVDALDPEAPDVAEPDADALALEDAAEVTPAAPIREPVPDRRSDRRVTEPVSDRRSDRRRRSSRKGLGLAVTGGCAGIAVCAFLLVGNGSGSSGGSAPTGPVSSRPAGQSSGVGQVDIPQASVPGSPLPSTTSPSPSMSPSPSPSRSASPSSAASSPAASPSATKHRGKPSASPTSTQCFLFWCS